jgi:hypothetical protein
MHIALWRAMQRRHRAGKRATKPAQPMRPAAQPTEEELSRFESEGGPARRDQAAATSLTNPDHKSERERR